MKVEKKARVWQLVKIPLIVVISIAILLALTITFAYVIKGTRVKGSIHETRGEISMGTLKSYKASMNSVKELLKKHPGRDNVLSAAAWAYSYGAYTYYGPDQHHIKESKKLLPKISKTERNDLFWAANALNLILEEKSEEAVKLTKTKVQKFKGSNELKFTHALALMRSRSTIEAAIELELLRSRKKPFIPAMIELAKLKQASGDLEGCLVVLNEITNLQPDNILALIETAHVRTAMGGKSLSQAQKLVKKVAQYLENSPPVIYSRGYLTVGKLSIRKDNFKEAIDPLEKAYKSMPLDYESAHALALAYRKTGKPLSALKTLAKFTDLKKLPTDVISEKVESNLMVGRTRAAKAAVEELILRPDFETKNAHFLAGQIEAHSDNFPNAVSHFQAAGGSSDMQLQTAFYMAKTGQLRESAKILKVMSKVENNPCATLLYEWYFKKGKAALKQTKKFNQCPINIKTYLLESSSDFSGLLELVEKNGSEIELPFSLYYTAIALWRTNGRKIARKEMEKIFRYSPESLQLLTGMTETYLAMGLTKKAVQTAQYCYEKNFDNPAAHALLAEVLRSSNKLEDSEKTITEALKKFPDDPVILLQKARMLVDKDKLSEATSILENNIKKLASAADIVRAAVLLSNIYNQINNEKEADMVLLTAARKIEKYYDPAASLDVFAEVVAAKRGQGGKKNIAKSKGIFNSKARKPFPSAKLYFEGGKTMLTAGKNEEAAERFLKSIAIDPAFKPAYLELLNLDALNEAHKMNFEKIFEEKL